MGQIAAPVPLFQFQFSHALEVLLQGPARPRYASARFKFSIASSTSAALL